MDPSEAGSPGAMDIGGTQREAEPFLARKGAVICKGGQFSAPSKSHLWHRGWGMLRPGEEDGSLEIPLLPGLSVGKTPDQILNF